MRTRIKICGITSPAIAHDAVSAGADAIGLIFHRPSARHLELAQAAEICRAVAPFVATVAVMVNPTAARVGKIIQQVNPSCLQFHGDEPADFCAAFGKPYIKALRVAKGVDLRAALKDTAQQHAAAAGILLDTHANDRYGGTGSTFDWGRVNNDGHAHDHTHDHDNMPIILAGGLSVDNIAKALAQVAPYGVDVSSGVETNGHKDSGKIRQFCQQVHGLID